MELTPDFLTWARDWLAAPDEEDVHPFLTTHIHWMVVAVDGENWSLLIFQVLDDDRAKPSVSSRVQVISRDGEIADICAGELATDRRWWLSPDSNRMLCPDWWDGDDFLVADASSWEGCFVDQEVEVGDDWQPGRTLKDFYFQDRLRTNDSPLIRSELLLQVEIEGDEYSIMGVSVDPEGFVWTGYSGRWNEFNGTLSSTDAAIRAAVRGFGTVVMLSHGFDYEESLRENGGYFSSGFFTPQQMWEVISSVISVKKFLKVGDHAGEDQPQWFVECVDFDGELHELAALNGIMQNKRKNKK